MPGATVTDRKPNEVNAVALTFDDGPADWTVPILETLRDSGVRATFFVIGESVNGRESILERTAHEGHEIGNHTLTHPRLDQIRVDEIAHELIAASSAIKSVLGVEPAVFRPPGFQWSPDVRTVATQCGFDRLINASVWTDDYNLNTAEEIVRAILDHENLSPGAIIDLHDGKPQRELPYPDGTRDDRLPTVEAVKTIVPALLERGLKLLTVSELLALG